MNPYTPQNLDKWTRPKSYFGATWEGYYVAPVSRHRDSDCLTESNWAMQWAILEPLGAFNPGDDDGEEGKSPCVVSENHWACGWVEWVAIHESNADALRAADKLADDLERYPVLNEEDFSSRETKEAEEVWRNCYNDRERLEWLRENRRNIEPHSFSDLLGCARGKFFIGNASELLP